MLFRSGPKIEMRRRKGEENAALALARITSADADRGSVAVPMSCGGGTEQLTEEAQARV